MDETITVAEAKLRFSKLLRHVRQGRSYILTSRGRPIAKLIPTENNARTGKEGLALLLARLESQPPLRGAKARKRWTREQLYNS